MFLDKVDLLVLKEIESNSRAYLKDIAERAGVSIQTISKRLERLERKLKLRYTVELKLDALGMQSEHLIRVKFPSGMAPDADVVKRAVSSPFVQLACRMKGDFDLFLWAVAPNARVFSSVIEPGIREELNEYIEDWIAHPIVSHRAGFLPISEDLIKEFKIRESRKEVLRILNSNSRIPIMKLAEQLGVTEPTAEYHLKKAQPFIKRFTAFFEGKGEFTHVVRFFQVKGKKKDIEAEGRGITQAYLDSDPRLFNRLVYASMPSGGMDCCFIETYSSLEDCCAATEQLLSEKRIIGRHVSAVVSKVLKGAIPIRKVDLASECKCLLSPVDASEELR